MLLWIVETKWSKRLIRKRNLSPLNVTRVDRGLTRFQSIKAETPGSACGTDSCGKLKMNEMGTRMTVTVQKKKPQQKDDVSSDWLDTAAHAVVTLETVAHEMLSAEFHKYNQKMWQLAFTLKMLNMSPNELKVLVFLALLVI
ncbi:bromo-adjacent homology domain-containing family protein [Striga asiatica]|uniref:Bromo-adjacent homology domain-containing family protein n=1 Tax=Striga asiatica TaxID=4170 RepID=A0A5A7R338_STRAF|nr:bromo-adjacent homology domain-containing family protein [Striga asiatica]